MTSTAGRAVLPELDEFRRQLLMLSSRPPLAELTSGDQVRLAQLSLVGIEELLRDDVGWYFLLSATGLNRTSLRTLAATDAEAQIVGPKFRRAQVVRTRLPVIASFSALSMQAVALRTNDLQRKARGQTEQFFRERLTEERIPLVMSPPRVVVPGVLIAGRKPDGVWPDPATRRPPEIYLEIKRIRRVADDIQKRLYELAEASLEMKLLYSDVALTGLAVAPSDMADRDGVAARMRSQILGARPVVVGLFLCPRAEAERYRTGAEALIDHIFFQEEIDACVELLARLTSDSGQG